MQSNHYNLIEFPFTDSLFEMPKKQLRAYLKWFVEQITGRIIELNRVVTTTTGYEGWKADYSPESLKTLSEWFMQEVKENVQALKAKKVDAAMDSDKIPVDIRYFRALGGYRSESLCFDVGIYIYKMLITNVKPDIEWVQDLRNRRNLEFGQPMLNTSEHLYPTNPVGMVRTVALRFVDGGPDRITEVYKMIAGWCNDQPVD